MLGMRTFDQSIVQLFRQGMISEEIAIHNADRPSDMKIKLHKARFSDEEQRASKRCSKISTHPSCA